MIKIKHPIDSFNIEQEKQIKALPYEQRKEASLLFSYGNASYRYHNLEIEPTEEDYIEWLSGLENPFKKGMQNLGFNKCKTVLSFTRYVREKRDIGMDEFIKNLMGNDYFEFKNKLKID